MIKLNDNYHITNDANNWVLNYKEEKTKKSGETYEAVDSWYFSKLSDLLSRFLDNEMKDAKTAKELLGKINEVEQIIKKLK